jgi:hypothetical protein
MSRMFLAVPSISFALTGLLLIIDHLKLISIILKKLQLTVAS